MSKLLDFYLGDETTAEGYSRREMLDGNHPAKNQWLFPTQYPSDFGLNAPLADLGSIRTFRKSLTCEKNLLLSLADFLKSLGLTIRCDFVSGYEIIVTPEFEERRTLWLEPGNHNHLKITRVLVSLRLLGVEKWAVFFYRGLQSIVEQYPESFSPQMLKIWRIAALGE